MGLEKKLGSLRGGHNNSGNKTELHMHNWAIFLGQPLQIAMRAITRNSHKMFSPSSSDTKHFTHIQLRSYHIIRPSCIPGHPLLPDPNGRNPKSLPLKSMSLPKNLSGKNFSGSFQYSVSLPIVHVFMITREFWGMWKPLTVQSSMGA
ncbi:hypothetical protein G4B88_008251 [Cannabis sativa]|uniref:Uncharacterized protein n=1 Tax=Cannabis sativa TaxID=3483 RepID=A0A7J6FLF1_CANSA|nr:hypothetical protein G4B88_008251 [Cannabis sativa]